MVGVSGETRNAVSAWTIDSLKEYLEVRLLALEKADTALREVIDERDRLYKERDDSRRTAVDAALAAAKEQTASSFSASEKAIGKAENAQADYNVRSNEFRGQLDDQAKTLMPRQEVTTLVKSIEDKIARLDGDIREVRDSVRGYAGKEQGGKTVRDDTRSNLAVAISFIALLVMVAMKLMGR